MPLCIPQVSKYEHWSLLFMISCLLLKSEIYLTYQRILQMRLARLRGQWVVPAFHTKTLTYIRNKMQLTVLSNVSEDSVDQETLLSDGRHSGRVRQGHAPQGNRSTTSIMCRGNTHLSLIIQKFQYKKKCG